MSGHHGHHRSSHHSRSRMHHSSSSHYSSMQRSRTSSSAATNDGGNNGSSHHRSAHQDHGRDAQPSSCDWQEHKSSSGKVYYYNPRTGISQWEMPLELRQLQAKSHQAPQQPHPQQQQHQQQAQAQPQQQQQQQRLASPSSELSESSSIRQQQDNSPSSSGSSHHSAQSDSVIDDKPLLTPSLVHYFRPELIPDFNSTSQREELQNQASQLDREILLLNERLLDERVEIKICKSKLEHATTFVEAQETKCAELRKTIERFGIPNYQ